MSKVRLYALLAASIILAWYPSVPTFGQNPDDSSAPEAGSDEDSTSIASTEPLEEELVVIGSHIRGISAGGFRFLRQARDGYDDCESLGRHQPVPPDSAVRPLRRPYSQPAASVADAGGQRVRTERREIRTDHH